MKKFIPTVLVIFCLFILVACTADQTEQIEATRPAATAVAVESTATTVVTEPAIAPTATAVSTEEVAATEPAATDLDTFLMALETAVTSQDYTTMQSLMSDPIATGIWRTEWHHSTPSQTIELFQNASLPAPLAVQFTGLSPDEIAALIGRNPADIVGGSVNIVAALHSTGWGQSTSDEAILFVAEADGRYTWYAFLYVRGRFADAYLSTTTAPLGLIYIVWGEGLYQIQADGQRRQLLDAEQASIPNLRVAPDGRHVAYFNEEQKQLWIIDTATGEQQQFATDFTLSGYLLWGDKDTLFVGIWLDPSEGDGPNNGHIATLEIPSGELTILDDTRLSSGRPSLLSDYNWVAFDVFTTGQDDILSGRHYHPDSGLRIFDQTTFSGNLGNSIFNPAWSPDPSKITWLTGDGERRVLQLFDVEAKTAVTLFDWDPARFGALIPSPIWSPNGQWLALEVWANGPNDSGIWLLAADGSSQTLVDGQGHEPFWVNNSQLVYGVNDGPRLYDVNSGEIFRMDLPEGSWILAVANLADLVAQVNPIRVADTPVAYVLAMQDVPMYSGDDDSYEQIGTIFGGQTALVTGQSLKTNWWRVICPDDTIGDCWVADDPAYTVPVDTANPITELPDPADLTMSVVQTTSPDGRWQANAAQSESVLIIDRDRYYVSLTVTDGTTTWTPVAEWRNDGLGADWLAVYRWSDDSRYLYYTNMGSVDGCSMFINGTDLFRLDVTDGSVLEILQPGKTMNISLSPDSSMLAYAGYDGQAEIFVVKDIATGEERRASLIQPNEVTQMSEIFWSSDGQTAVLTLIHGACGPIETSSIVRINIEDMTITTLIADDERFFQIQDWPNPDQAEIHLIDKDGNFWWLEINSGELAQED